MRVAFFRDDEARVSGWTAVRGKRTIVPGPLMALGRGGIPHDLAQYVIEASTGYEHGFWGLLAKGATFASTGRKRTKPGRAVIVEHRDELNASEQLAGLHLTAWQRGISSDVTRALAAADAAFRTLRLGETLAYTWPSPVGRIEDNVVARANA